MLVEMYFWVYIPYLDTSVHGNMQVYLPSKSHMPFASFIPCSDLFSPNPAWNFDIFGCGYKVGRGLEVLLSVDCVPSVIILSRTCHKCWTWVFQEWKYTEWGILQRKSKETCVGKARCAFENPETRQEWRGELWPESEGACNSEEDEEEICSRDGEKTCKCRYLTRYEVLKSHSHTHSVNIYNLIVPGRGQGRG